MSVALSIAFTGLCALIADGDGAPGQVLLLDGKGLGEVRNVNLPEHAPTLVMSLRDLANPDSSAPSRVIAGAPGQTSRVDQLGLWDLTGSEVWIRAQGGGESGLQLFKPSRETTSWPEAPRNPHDPTAWRDLRFVADMKNIVGDGRVDPALMGDGGPTAAGLPPSVAARVHLDAGLLQGGIPSQELYRDDMFEFSDEGSERTTRQALTDTILWTLKSEAAAVVIDIVPVKGGPTRRLLLAPSATPHRLFVSNLPVENGSHATAHGAMSDEEMSALHFGAYYKLLLERPAFTPLPTPFRAARERKGTGGIRTQFCVPARFSRQ